MRTSSPKTTHTMERMGPTNQSANQSANVYAQSPTHGIPQLRTRIHHLTVYHIPTSVPVG